MKAHYVLQTKKLLPASLPVCLTLHKGKMVPVFYMIISKPDWSIRTIPNVSLGGDEALTMDSITTKGEGNKPETGGNVSSRVKVGWCRPKSNTPHLLIKGAQSYSILLCFRKKC